MVVLVGKEVLLLHPLKYTAVLPWPSTAGKAPTEPYPLLNAGGGIEWGWKDGWSSIHLTSWINYSDIPCTWAGATSAELALCGHTFNVTDSFPVQLNWLRQVVRLTVWPLCSSSVLPHECKSMVRPSRLGLKIEPNVEEPFVSGWRHHAAGTGRGALETKINK